MEMNKTQKKKINLGIYIQNAHYFVVYESIIIGNKLSIIGKWLNRL